MDQTTIDNICEIFKNYVSSLDILISNANDQYKDEQKPELTRQYLEDVLANIFNKDIDPDILDLEKEISENKNIDPETAEQIKSAFINWKSANNQKIFMDNNEEDEFELDAGLGKNITILEDGSIVGNKKYEKVKSGCKKTLFFSDYNDITITVNSSTNNIYLIKCQNVKLVINAKLMSSLNIIRCKDISVIIKASIHHTDISLSDNCTLIFDTNSALDATIYTTTSPFITFIVENDNHRCEFIENSSLMYDSQKMDKFVFLAKSPSDFHYVPCVVAAPIGFPVLTNTTYEIYQPETAEFFATSYEEITNEKILSTSPCGDRFIPSLNYQK